MAVEKRPDTPLATSPNAVFMSSQDSTKVKTPYVPGRVTPEQRAAQKKVREENTRKRDSVLQRNANVAGITREELRKEQAKNNKRPDVQVDGLRIKDACKRGESKGSCSTGQTNRGESLRDNK
jgi:hypothetical protein